MITIPLDENLEKEVDFAQLYIDYELKAIMNIKLKFFDWFEDMLKSLIEKAQRKKKKNAMKKQDDSQSFQHGNPDASNDNGILSSLALGVQDPPSASIATTDHHHHHHNDPNAICTEEDVLVDNPQKKLQCIMCKLKGELTITGRLIPFQVNQFVHVNCALWSTDVHEIAEGGYLINFFQIWTTRARFTRCTHCGEPGASLYCSSTRSRCMAAYHFPCAYRNKKMAFAPRGVKETICEICCKGSRGIHTGLPNEYANTKRRYQIAKNQQPYNMTHHMTSLTLQQQSQLVPASAIQINGGSTSAADIEKPLQIEKWRPFFFDMFNRVGNMTVLSLRKEINQIIEEYCTSSKNNQDSQKDLKDFSTVRIYWKHFDIKNCEEGKNSDENIEMKEESTLGNGIGGKAFYLFTNNQIKELAYNDLEALLPYVCFRVNEKVNLGLHYLCQNPDEIRLIAERRNLLSQDFLQAQVFWQKLIQHFTLERLKFSLNNIIFSMSEFSGKTKYPVSIWNRGAEGTKNKAFFLRAGEQVLHAQGIQSQAAIFADKEFARDGSIQGTASVFISGQVESGRVISFGNNGAAISGSFKRGGDIVSYGNGTQQLIRAGIPTTIDDIFRRMTKINQMGDHQNPMASVKRVNASKHMQYEAVLHNLGKKMFYKAPPANSALFEETGPSSAVANNSINTKQKQAQSGTATTKGLQKKVRQADTVGGGQGMLGGNDAAAVSKESDLPIAMKYRLSKTQPKRVEVGPSKIHRNGLFTLEDLAGGDIVIEYVGEKIRNKVADKREIVYEQKGIGDCYLFRLDKELIIDATFNGNKARYLNHSCDANCSAKIINVQQQKHIIISANRPIKSGEELTYNYNFDYEADKIECFCGAPGCLGRLN